MKKLIPFLTLLMIVTLISGTFAQTTNEYTVDEIEQFETDLAAGTYDEYILTTSGGIYDLTNYITITTNTVLRAAEGLADKPVLMRTKNTGVGAGMFRIQDETVNIGLVGLIFDGTVEGENKISGFRSESTAHFYVNNCVFRYFTEQNGVFRMHATASSVDVRNSVFHDSRQRMIHLYIPDVAYGDVNIDNCLFYNISGPIVFTRIVNSIPAIGASLIVNHSTFHNITVGTDGVFRGRQNNATGETKFLNSVFTNISADTPLATQFPDVVVDYCYVDEMSPKPSGTNLFTTAPVYEDPANNIFRITNADNFLVASGDIAGVTLYYPPRLRPDLFLENGTHVRLTFNRPMEATTVENTENYTLSGTFGLTGNPSSATLINEREVLLNVGDISDVPYGESIVVTVTGVKDTNGVLIEGNNVAVYQLLTLEVIADEQTVSNGPGQAVIVQSSSPTGFVYIVLKSEPQQTKAELDAAVAASKGAFATVTASNTNISISASNLVPGQYYAYAVSTDGALSEKSTSSILVIDKTDIRLVSPVQTDLLHPAMEMRIGYPAIIAPGGDYPSLNVLAFTPGTADVKIIREDNGAIVHETTPRSLTANESATFTFDGTPEVGRYTIRTRMFVGDDLAFQDTYYFTVLDVNTLPTNNSVAVHPGADGKLVYTPDFRGNRIPDFSYVGYRGSEGVPVPIPDVPVKLELEPMDGDDTARIQAAINEVSNMPLDAEGFRGTVLLKKGIYEIGGTLNIRASGVVLRGEGQGDLKNLWLNPALGMTLEELKVSLADKPATILIATGPERRYLIRVEGTAVAVPDVSTATDILDFYVPVGVNTFTVNSSANLSVGDRIIVERRGNDLWISEIAMDRIPGEGITQWTPFNLQFEYEITAINGNHITIHSSLVNAIEKQWGGGRIFKYSDPGRISHSAVENLRAISFWKKNQDGVDDTRHADRFLLFNNIRDGWARNLTAEHFYENGTFMMERNSIAMTIENSSNLIAPRAFFEGPGYDPSGRTFYETGVYTGRYGFHFTGQHGLVKDCYAVNNRHAFVVNSRVTGPNVFVNCSADNSLTWSEPHHRWSTGGLYDNVKDMISLMNRLNYGTGHGWAGANFVAWNTEGIQVVEQPPTAQNWAIGHIGERRLGPFHNWNMTTYGYSAGYWEKRGSKVQPFSLYYKQLEDRTGVMLSAPAAAREVQNRNKVEVFPNPSTGSGTIRFYLEREGWNEITIYDLSGRQASQSEKQFFPAGTHQQAWDFGGLPNGIYIIQLRTESGVSTSKMVLQR
jgi:hypothetical protein